MRKVTFGLGAALLIAATLAPAASAGAPREVVQKKDVAHLVFDGNTQCLDQGYDFTFTQDFVRTRTTTLWFDENGAVVKEVRMIHFKGIDSNDLDPTKSVEMGGTRYLVFDFLAGTVTETGSNWHITVPGRGTVLLHSGRAVYTLDFGTILWEAGPHQGSNGDYAEYCAALA